MHPGIELRYPDPHGRWTRLPWVYLAHRRWSVAARSVDAVACATTDALVLSEAPGLRCIDAKSGEERWRDDAPRPERAWPAMGESLVALVLVAYRTEGEDHLEALAVQDGSQRWKRSWPRGSREPTRTARVVVAAEAVVTTRGPDPDDAIQLTACALETGEELWSRKLEGEELPDHLVLGADAVGLTQGERLQIHDLDDGDLRWWYELGKQPVAHLAQAGETWVCWSAAGTLTAFDPAGGVRWKKTITRGDAVPTALRLDEERIQLLDEKRHSIDLVSGEERWKGERPQGASQVLALTANQAYVHYAGDPVTAYGWLSSPLLPPASGAACAAINVAGSLDPPPVDPDEGPKLADLRAVCERLRNLDPDDEDASDDLAEALTAAIGALPVGRATEKIAEGVCEAALRQALERGGTSLFAAGQVGDALHEALRTYRWEVANQERRAGLEAYEPDSEPELEPTPEPKVPSDIEPIPLDVLRPSPKRTWTPPTTGRPPPPPPPEARDVPWVQIMQAVVCVVWALGFLIWLIAELT